MAINPTPQVKIVESIDTAKANPNSITYNIARQVEPISGAVGRVYDATTGDLLFTYYNDNTPTFTSDGYLFPMEQITSSTPASIVDWAQGKSVSDWTNNAQYYIEIAVVGRSGSSSNYSSGELFWCVQSPTGNISTIGTSGVVSTTQVVVTTSINLQQSTVPNLVERYRVVLNDITTNQVAQDTEWIYGSGIGSGTSYTITHTFYDLDDAHQYSVQFVAYTQQKSPIEANSNTFVVDTGLSIDGLVVGENNCEGGYINVTATITNAGSSLSANPNYIRLERAIVDGDELSWVGIYEEAMPSDFNPTTSDPTIVTYKDYYAEANATVRYRATPIYRQAQLDIQGVGITSSVDVVSQFNKFFIVDSATQYGFVAGVAFDSLVLNQQTGIHQPLGAKYPIIVRNSNTKYRNGGFSLTITPSNFDVTSQVISKTSRYDMVKVRRDIGDFLTNGAPKIIKDWNGNIWLVEITDNINATFDNNVGMGVASISGTWVELGDVYDTNVLTQTGLTNIGG